MTILKIGGVLDLAEQAGGERWSAAFQEDSARSLVLF
jgi:hypothetical protein